MLDVSENWNGTLFLYSHAYDPPGTGGTRDDETFNVGTPYLLSHGYALAGSSGYALSVPGAYAGGWALVSQLPDGIAALDTFSSLVGKPKRTIAWGISLGGIVTAGLVQRNPHRFDGAVAISGPFGGGVGLWNQWLDAAFAFNTLLASGSGLQVVNIDPTCLSDVLNTGTCNNLNLALNVLSDAQTSREGRARIALVAALTDSPGWTDLVDPNPTDPSPTDYATREANQFLPLGQGGTFFLAFAGRADLEARAGGNPSWNTGVDYRKQLEHSVDYAEVKALYEQAGLSLDADLDLLNNTPRIAADPAAVKYLSKNISFNGDLDIPVVTLHTTGDDLVNVQNEQAYAAVVRRGHDHKLLRQLFVRRAGHGNFTDAEIIAAINALILRLDTGEWKGVETEDLNEAALSLGDTYNVLDYFASSAGVLISTPPGFVEYQPAPFLRPFDIPIQEEGKQ